MAILMAILRPFNASYRIYSYLQLFLFLFFWGVFQEHIPNLHLEAPDLHQTSWPHGLWGGPVLVTWPQSSPYSLGDIRFVPYRTGAGPEPEPEPEPDCGLPPHILSYPGSFNPKTCRMVVPNSGTSPPSLGLRGLF